MSHSSLGAAWRDCRALCDAGYSVWYDEFNLTLCDGLIRSIDRGLAESRYGIVIITGREAVTPAPGAHKTGAKLRVSRGFVP